MNPLPQACEILQDQIDEMSQVELQEAREFGLASQHLQQCPQCQAYWQQALALAEKLDQWQVPEPHKNIAAEVMTAIAQLEHDQRLTPGLWQRWMQQRLHIPVPVAAMILLALILSLAFNFKSPPSTPAATPIVLNQHQPTSGLLPVNMSYASNTVSPSTWGMPAMAPGTYVIILGAPPMMSNETLFSSKTNNPDHAL